MIKSAQSTDSSNHQRSSWKQDPEAVQGDILRAATEEFSTQGLSGARIEDIAKRTKTSKRMIYYYFDDKAGLYQKVLENAYAVIRQGEDQLNLDDLSPTEALKCLIAFSFEHQRQHPNFVRLVMIENIHHAKHLKKSEIIQNLNQTAIEMLEGICRRGQKEGVFRKDLNALKLHW